MLEKVLLSLSHIRTVQWLPELYSSSCSESFNGIITLLALFIPSVFISCLAVGLSLFFNMCAISGLTSIMSLLHIYSLFLLSYNANAKDIIESDRNSPSFRVSLSLFVIQVSGICEKFIKTIEDRLQSEDISWERNPENGNGMAIAFAVHSSRLKANIAL